MQDTSLGTPGGRRVPAGTSLQYCPPPSHHRDTALGHSLFVPSLGVALTVVQVQCLFGDSAGHPGEKRL